MTKTNYEIAKLIREDIARLEDNGIQRYLVNATDREVTIQPNPNCKNIGKNMLSSVVLRHINQLGLQVEWIAINYDGYIYAGIGVKE